MSLTMREKEKILRIAEGYISDPRNWIKGKWRRKTQRVDMNGERICQFCIHGAGNQATVDVIGLERAIELGAAKRHGPGYSLHGMIGACIHLDLDSVTRELHGHAMAMGYNDAFDSTHEGVLEILRRARARLRRK